MRFGIIANTYAYLRYASKLRKEFSKTSTKLDFISVKASSYQLEISPYHLDYFFKDNESPKSLTLEQAKKNYDVLFIGVGGKLLEKILAECSGADCITVTLFPGIREPSDLNGFYYRTNSDLMLLNNSADFKSCKKYFDQCFLDSGMLFISGLPFERAAKKSASKNKNKVYFLAQNLNSLNQVKLKELILDFCYKNSEAEIIFLTKKNINLFEPHKIPIPWEDLFANMSPSNFSISYEKLDDAFELMDACITISSAGAVEAIQNNIPTYVVSDFGKSDMLGNKFFEESGLFSRINQIDLDQIIFPNEDWKKKYLFKFDQKKLFLKIEKVIENKRNFNKPITIFNVAMLRLLLIFSKIKIMLSRVFVR